MNRNYGRFTHCIFNNLKHVSFLCYRNAVTYLAYIYNNHKQIIVHLYRCTKFVDELRIYSYTELPKATAVLEFGTISFMGKAGACLFTSGM